VSHNLIQQKYCHCWWWLWEGQPHDTVWKLKNGQFGSSEYGGSLPWLFPTGATMFGAGVSSNLNWASAYDSGYCEQDTHSRIQNHITCTEGRGRKVHQRYRCSSWCKPAVHQKNIIMWIETDINSAWKCLSQHFYSNSRRLLHLFLLSYIVCLLAYSVTKGGRKMGTCLNICVSMHKWRLKKKGSFSCLWNVIKESSVRKICVFTLCFYKSLLLSIGCMSIPKLWEFALERNVLHAVE